MGSQPVSGPDVVEDLRTSDLVLSIRARAVDGRITVGAIIDGAGARAYGLALLVFALPEALPLPVMGMSAIIGLPLMLLSAQLAFLGARPRLPRRIMESSISLALFDMAIARGVPILRRAERLSSPRWQRLSGAGRLLGFVCLILAVVVALPIPLGNMPPAICVVTIAFGMLQRDGLIVAAGLAAAAVTLIGMTAAGILAWELIVRMLA